MPYIVKGDKVYKKDGTFVGKSKNPKKYVRVLRAVEHDWKPEEYNTGKK